MVTAIALSACGGGDSSADNSGLTDATAQGYAADAATMPVVAASGLESASATLESALATSTTASQTQARVLAVPGGDAAALATLPTVTVACPGGGTVAWTITGGTLAQQLNGRLDVGERYDIVFTACAGNNPGPVLDGNASLTVTAYSETASTTASTTASDLVLAATALQLTTTQGRFVLSGGVRTQRTAVVAADGSRSITTRLTSQQITLATTLASRQASYELGALDWTVKRTLNAANTLTANSHQGQVSLASGTPRRPAATLSVVTQGSLTIGSDGLAAQGSFSLITAQDKLTVTYGNTTVVIALDQGNDGSTDRSWTLPRSAFFEAAG